MNGDTFVDEQEREHCRLDYHKALEASSQPSDGYVNKQETRLLVLGAWASKYGDRIATLLIDDGPSDTVEDLKEAEEEVEDLRRQLGNAQTAIKLAVDAYEDLDDPTAIQLDAIFTELEKATDGE